MARTLTGANSVIMLSVTGLFDTPQQLQGFAADDMLGTDAISSAETVMGVDGKLSGGFVFNPIVQNFTLQGDSVSCDLFERWWSAEQTIRESYIASGQIILPATNRKYTCTRGFLTSHSPLPDVKKLIQSRRWAITWQSISPAPGN